MQDTQSNAASANLKSQAWWRRLAWALLVTAVFWGGIWGGVKLVESLRTTRQLAMLKQGAMELQRAIEQYAVDHNGSYPSDLVELFLAEGLKQMPASPFGGELQILTERANPVPGGVAYVATGPMVLAAPSAVDSDPRTSTELDDYLLAIYGPTDHGAEPPAARPPLEWGRIAWDRVWILVRANEEPVSVFQR